MRKTIKEGEIIPKFYGVAWRYFHNYEIICYPIPINIFVRLFLHLYYLVMRGAFQSRYEKELLLARLEGARQAIQSHNKMLAEGYSKTEH